MKIRNINKCLNLLALVCFFSSISASANPMLLGDWFTEDQSGYNTKKIYLSILSETEAWKTTIVGEEAYEVKTVPIRFVSDFELELDGQLYDVQAITWKMKLCLKGARRCSEYRRTEGRYVFLPSVHYIPEKKQKLVVRVEDYSNTNTKTSSFEMPLDVSAMYPDRTSESQFGKDSVVEIESPNQDFKIRLKIKFYYTNADSAYGKSANDYSFAIEKEWLDVKSGSMVFSEFEEGEGLPSFWMEDPSGNKDIGFEFVEI